MILKLAFCGFPGKELVSPSGAKSFWIRGTTYRFERMLTSGIVAIGKDTS
jgi:hypothetical protein